AATVLMVVVPVGSCERDLRFLPSGYIAPQRVAHDLTPEAAATASGARWARVESLRLPVPPAIQLQRFVQDLLDLFIRVRFLLFWRRCVRRHAFGQGRWSPATAEGHAEKTSQFRRHLRP